MGACTTINVTRTKAMVYLAKRILTVDNATLGRMMDEALADQLYNVRVVPDHDEDNDDNVVRD